MDLFLASLFCFICSHACFNLNTMLFSYYDVQLQSEFSSYKAIRFSFLFFSPYCFSYAQSFLYPYTSNEIYLLLYKYKIQLYFNDVINLRFIFTILIVCGYVSGSKYEQMNIGTLRSQKQREHLHHPLPLGSCVSCLIQMLEAKLGSSVGIESTQILSHLSCTRHTFMCQVQCSIVNILCLISCRHMRLL